MEESYSMKLLNRLLIAAQVFIIAAFIWRGRYLLAVESGIIFVISVLFIYYEKKKGFLIDNYIKWLVFLTIIANSYLGEYMDLYTNSHIFDKGLHVFGAFSLSLLLYTIIYKLKIAKKGPRIFVFIFIVSIGALIGSIYEVGEFLTDKLFNTNSQRGLTDTDLDILSNLIGSSMAGLYAAYIDPTLKKRPMLK